MSEEPKGGELQEIYELLPWFAAGTLPPGETVRVAKAIASHPALALTLARIEEERAEAIVDNEARPTLRGTAFDRLMAQIETEAPRRAKSAAGHSVLSRLLAAIAALTPRTIAFAGFAAALVIVIEGGLLVGLVAGHGGKGAHYETASVNPNVNTAATSFLLVQFAGGASIEAITSFLRDRNATIVDGPLAGGLFRIGVPADQAGAILDELNSRKDLVGFASRTD